MLHWGRVLSAASCSPIDNDFKSAIEESQLTGRISKQLLQDNNEDTQFEKFMDFESLSDIDSQVTQTVPDCTLCYRNIEAFATSFLCTK